MFPVIFKLSFIEARSYYVLWASALLLFVFWTRERAEKLYGMDDDDVTSVLLWIYCAGILGSYGASVIFRFPHWLRGEISFGTMMKGLVSWGGMLAGGAAGLLRLRRLRLSVDAFADAAAVPAAAMLAAGRIGCGLEGCCAGIGCSYTAGAPWWAVHMHYDAVGFLRFPSQFAESFFSFVILLILLCTQKFLAKHKAERQGGFLFPLFLILYAGYRLFFDRLRDLPSNGLTQDGSPVWIFAVVVGVLWLSLSIVRLRTSRLR